METISINLFLIEQNEFSSTLKSKDCCSLVFLNLLLQTFFYFQIFNDSFIMT